MLINIVKKIGIGLARFFEIFFALITVYVLFYWTLSRIPINDISKVKLKRDHVVYITSNGVHTDFVMPIKNDLKDWGEELKLTEAFKQDSTRTFVAIGWGDKNFFLKTKEWSDLTVGTTVSAMFGLGTGAVHIVQKPEPNSSQPDVIKLRLSKEQYNQLCHYIEGNFLKTNGKLSPIKKHPYSQYDFFFDANSSYSMIYTCNSWTNTGLKKCGQPACLWTPFKDGIFVRYGK